MHIDNFILYIRLWKRKRLDTSSWESSMAARISFAMQSNICYTLSVVKVLCILDYVRACERERNSKWVKRIFASKTLLNLIP